MPKREDNIQIGTADHYAEDIQIDDIHLGTDELQGINDTIVEHEEAANVIDDIPQIPPDQYRREYRQENPAPTHGRNTRSSRKYSNYISATNPSNKIQRTMIGYGYNVSYEKAMRSRPEATDAAADNEILQLVNLDIGEGVDESSLSYKQLSNVLRTFMFMKDKYDSKGAFIKCKGRLVGDGRDQSREYLNSVYGSTSSPTALLTSVMIVLGLAAARKMHTSTLDVAGAFLRNNLDDETFIRLSSTMTRKWIKYKPSDAQYVTKKGEIILKLKKSLYGCVQSPLLWYKNVNSYLTSLGFKPSSKDPCVYTKWDDDKLTIIITYVDDFLVLSDCQLLGKNYGDLIDNHYEQVTRHNEVELDYIGMTIENDHEDSSIKLSMLGFTEDILSLMPKTRTCSTPAGTNLFEIKGGPLLSPEKSKLFYSVVYMLLYLAKRTRPDILLPVQFLTCRVTKSTIDDWLKLQRVCNYLHDTKDLKMKLRGQSTADLICYVDASHAVHDNYRSHTGVVITIGGRCIVFIKSTKQGINGKSSTESELIAVSDALPQIIYTKEFLEEILSHDIDTVLMQDNTSTIRLIEEGRALSESTRHINIRFFYVHDYISNGVMKVQHCKTENMRADGFTKPLQGEAFIEFRSYVLGLDEVI